MHFWQVTLPTRRVSSASPGGVGDVVACTPVGGFTIPFDMSVVWYWPAFKHIRCLYKSVKYALNLPINDTGKEMWMHRRLIEPKGSLGFLDWTVDMGSAGCVLIICDDLSMSGVGMVRGSCTEALVQSLQRHHLDSSWCTAPAEGEGCVRSMTDITLLRSGGCAHSAFKFSGRHAER